MYGRHRARRSRALQALEEVGLGERVEHPPNQPPARRAGYRLASGRSMPLLLDEAVAVATGLITAAGIAAFEETALRTRSSPK
jgi:hypothetical protein